MITPFNVDVVPVINQDSTVQSFAITVLSDHIQRQIYRVRRMDCHVPVQGFKHQD